jgi:hypothetical protein
MELQPSRKFFGENLDIMETDATFQDRNAALKWRLSIFAARLNLIADTIGCHATSGSDPTPRPTLMKEVV